VFRDEKGKLRLRHQERSPIITGSGFGGSTYHKIWRTVKKNARPQHLGAGESPKESKKRPYVNSPTSSVGVYRITMRAHPGKLVAPSVVRCSFDRLSLPRTEKGRLRSEPLWLPGGTAISTISPRRLVHDAGWSPETGIKRDKRAPPACYLQNSSWPGETRRHDRHPASTSEGLHETILPGPRERGAPDQYASIGRSHDHWARS